MEASCTGKLEVVKYLVDNEANPDIQNDYNSTALMWASFGGYLKIVQYLVENGGADINIENNDNETALDIATEQGRRDIVRYLGAASTVK